jgi:hypothetical protein
MENFKIEVDGDGVALVTFDVPGRSMNTLTSGVIAEFPQVVERIRTEKAISKETDAELRRAIEGFQQSFGSDAARPALAGAGR